MYPLILVVLCDMANIRIHINCSFKNCVYLAMEKKKRAQNQLSLHSCNIKSKWEGNPFEVLILS